MIAATQRDYIAGEVSRDLTRRILLPEYISKAHDEGAIHFHDADYFIQPIFNCCLINIGDMLELPGGLYRHHSDHCLRGLQPVRRPERGYEPSGQVSAPQHARSSASTSSMSAPVRWTTPPSSDWWPTG